MANERRKKKMMELRQKGFSLTEIGEIYKISKQAVYKIIGSTGQVYYRKKIEKRRTFILNNSNKTNSDLSNIMELSKATIAKIRSGKDRFKIEGGENSKVAVGINAENWAINKLTNMGFSVEGMTYGKPFDLCVNGWRVDVKICTKPNRSPSRLKKGDVSPQWKFHVKANKRQDCDFYFCITGEKDVFIIPSNKISNNKTQIQFCYPTKYPSMGKYQKYHEAYHLLK